MFTTNKLQLWLLAMSLLALLGSCDFLNDDDDPVAEDPVPSDYIKQLDEAVQDSREYEEDQGFNSFEIRNTYTLNADDGLPGLHVVNYERGQEDRFLIHSADRRVPFHLAQGPGTFSQEDDTEGIGVWLRWQKGLASYLRQNEVSMQDFLDIYLQGEQLSILDPCEGYNVVRDIVPSNPEGLLSSKWGQGCSYNLDLAYCDRPNRCNRMPTGCVATAIAQILNYHQHPAYYSWDLMTGSEPSTSAGREHVSNLMKVVGDLVDMDYGCSGSGAYTCGKAPGAFAEMGYSTGPLGLAVSCVDELQSVELEIRNQRPVLMRGQNAEGGHAWVADGWLNWNWCILGEDALGEELAELLGMKGKAFTGYQQYLHMNWGWDGHCNGYFSVYNFTNYLETKPKFNEDASYMLGIEPDL